MNILIINGPNLNLLGTREPEIYGLNSFDDIKSYTERKCKDFEVSLDWFQSNHEGEIIDKVQSISSSAKYQALIINPAGLSHTSVSLLDALLLLDIPIIEVHISNLYKRDVFRQKFITAKASSQVLTGVGKDCYHVAVYSLIQTS